MRTHEPTTPASNHELASQPGILSFDELKTMMAEVGLTGATPQERLTSLRGMDKADLALFTTAVNNRLNGTTETMIHEGTMKVGEQPTIAPEHRYDLYHAVVDQIQQAPHDVNPARVGDALALTTVLMHPFKDGNGRTARMFGFMFREDFDSPEAQESFRVLSEPRDVARARGGFLINGYIPYMGEGANQSDPQQVLDYVGRLMTSDDERLYTGPYGQAQLRDPALAQATAPPTPAAVGS